MYFERLIIKEFGKFHNKEIALQNGFNLIYGKNEGGKTTVKDFVVAMLYGIDKARGIAARFDTYVKYKPYDRAGYFGMAELNKDGQSYLVERNFLKDEKKTLVTNEATGEEILLKEENQLEGSFFQTPKSTYINTLCIGSHGAAVGRELSVQLKDYLVKMATAKSAQINCSETLQYLSGEKKKYNTKKLEEQMQLLLLQMEKGGAYKKEQTDLEKRQHELEQAYSLQEEENGPRKNTLVMQGIWLAFMVLGFLVVFVALPSFSSLWKGILLGLIGLLGIGGFLFVGKGKDKKKETPGMSGREYGEQLAALKVKKELLKQAQQEYEKLLKEYRALKQEKEWMEQEKKAITLAMETIEDLSKHICMDMGSCFNQEISYIMSKITKGKYSQVKIDENLHMKLREGDRFVPMEYVSTGTLEQLYFALRMVVAKVLCKEELPILLDDIFTGYDEERLTEALNYLLTEWKGRQVILFTGNPYVGDILDNIGLDYNYVELT